MANMKIEGWVKWGEILAATHIDHVGALASVTETSLISDYSIRRSCCHFARKSCTVRMHRIGRCGNEVSIISPATSPCAVH